MMELPRRHATSTVWQLKPNSEGADSEPPGSSPTVTVRVPQCTTSLNAQVTVSQSSDRDLRPG